jgi:hypothetical protein
MSGGLGNRQAATCRHLRDVPADRVHGQAGHAGGPGTIFQRHGASRQGTCFAGSGRSWMPVMAWAVMSAKWMIWSKTKGATIVIHGDSADIAAVYNAVVPPTILKDRSNSVSNPLEIGCRWWHIVSYDTYIRD